MDKKKETTTKEINLFLKENIVNPLADIESSDFTPTPLKTYEQNQSQIRKKYWKNFQEYEKKVEKGIDSLLKAKAWPETTNIKHVKKVFKSPDSLVKYMDNNHALYEALGFSDESMDKAFDVAINFYENQKLEKASEVLFVLTQLNPYAYDYWTTLGLSEYEQEDYLGASMALIVALESDDNPDLSLYYYLIDSMIAIDNIEGATKALDDAFEKAKKLPKEETSEILTLLESIKAILPGTEKTG